MTNILIYVEMEETKFQAAKSDMLALLQCEFGEGMEDELERITEAGKTQPGETIQQESQTPRSQPAASVLVLAQETDDWEEGGVVRAQSEEEIVAQLEAAETESENINEQLRRNGERLAALDEGHEWMYQQIRVIRQWIAEHRDGAKA